MTALANARRLAEMIRVDHAGEHGAVRIYDGQKAVFDKIEGKEEMVELVAHVRHDELRLARAHRLTGGADAAVVNDCRRLREQHRMTGIAAPVDLRIATVGRVASGQHHSAAA